MGGWYERRRWYLVTKQTLRVVLVLTCLTIVSAKDLSNYKSGKSAFAFDITWAYRPVGGPSWPTGE